MKIHLENDVYAAEIESFGAELQSLIQKASGQEVIWEADPTFWGKTSPILFPFIGKLQGEAFRHKNKTYAMSKHGFARDMDFAVEKQEADLVVFRIQSDETTLAKFPFPFVLKVEYGLSENGIRVRYYVENAGNETMYFSIGGHPAFACPLIKDGKRPGKRTLCKVKVYGASSDALVATEIDMATGLLSGEKYSIESKKGLFPVVDHIFDKDAIVLENQGVTAVGFVDEKGEEYVRLEAPDCPVWGIWSMPTSDASYVCIEPWWGICDAKGYEGELKDRPYTNKVEPGKVWERGFDIILDKSL